MHFPYRPYLWGPASTENHHKQLNFSEAEWHLQRFLAAIDANQMLLTALYFPVWRTLLPEQIQQSEVLFPSIQIFPYPYIKIFSVSCMRMCMYIHNVHSTCYTCITDWCRLFPE